MSYPDTQLFIDGQWCDAASGQTLAVLNPATGQEIGRVAHAGIADLDRALAAAQTRLRDCGATRRRSSAAPIMRRAAALMRERAADIGALMTQEQGKPLAEAKAEAMIAGRHHRMVCRRRPPRLRPHRAVAFDLAVQQMVLQAARSGPVAAFTPWNFPINQVVRKLSAALATGCSMIVKAPEETPASPAALIQAFVDAGVPAGVVGLVYGNPAEISAYLIPHPVIRKITFTGSTPVGKQLAALAGTAHEARDHGARRPRAGDRGRGRRHRRWPSSARARPSSATPGRCASRRRASWCTRASAPSSPQRWPSTRRR